MKSILLINVKMPTIVGILTFIGRINSTSVLNKKILIIIIFSILLSVKVKLSCSVGLSMKKFYNLAARYHTGKCIRRFGGIYAYCRCFIDRKW